jgi:hypothetical protein
MASVSHFASLPLPSARLGHIALRRAHPTLLLQSLPRGRGTGLIPLVKLSLSIVHIDIAPSLPCYVLAARVLVVSVLAVFL